MQRDKIKKVIDADNMSWIDSDIRRTGYIVYEGKPRKWWQVWKPKCRMVNFHDLEKDASKDWQKYRTEWDIN